MSTHLTEEQLDEFRENGVLVIDNVFSEAEVSETRTAFHAHLSALGIDHDAILAGEKIPDTGPRIKSPISRIFYPKWKLLNIHLHPKLTTLAEDLLVKTFGRKEKNFEHPYEEFSSILAYVDRVCWRLPDSIRAEGGLGLHLDRDPADPYLENNGGLRRWRPIQSLVCLTDHFHGDSGGLRLVPGFHNRIDEYFKGKSSGNGGEFFRMNNVQHDTLQKQCRPVIASAGSVIFWDNRLPHATASHLSGYDTREVVYTGFLPNIKLNKKYIATQLQAVLKNVVPPAYVENCSPESADRDWEEKDLTAVQKRLLGC